MNKNFISFSSSIMIEIRDRRKIRSSFFFYIDQLRLSVYNELNNDDGGVSMCVCVCSCVSLTGLNNAVCVSTHGKL
jgi:hypothetical protein